MNFQNTRAIPRPPLSLHDAAKANSRVAAGKPVSALLSREELQRLVAAMID